MDEDIFNTEDFVFQIILKMRDFQGIVLNPKKKPKNKIDYETFTEACLTAIIKIIQKQQDDWEPNEVLK